MHHPGDHLLPTLSLLLIIIAFTLFYMPKSFCQNQYITCGEPHECANMNFTYPFWGGDRPEACGNPGFNVSCQGNVPRIGVEPVLYRVLHVDTTAYTLTVARDDLWTDNCPRFLYNTTLNFSIFSYSNNIDNITLSYNCNSNFRLAQPQPLANEFNCTQNSTTPTASYFATSIASNANASLVTCTDYIIVPIFQTAVQSLTSTAALRVALRAGFPLQYSANNSICTDCTRSGGRCGYNTGANSFACYCGDREYDLVCNGTSTQSRHGRHRGLNLVTGLLIGIAAMIFALGIFYYLARRCSLLEAVINWKSDVGNNQQVEAFMRNYGSTAPKLYKYSEIKKITNSFADKLGHGGYGCVYKGKLSDGRQVAVKVLKDIESNGEEFINEVASISRTSHVNVVNLLGFSYNRNRRALIYEFMPNGSLDKFIYRKKRSSQDMATDCQLDWKILYEIAVGIARGLEYLHRGCNTRIVHFDIKPHNILLDKDFCPKISDFGLAKLCERKQSILSTIGARGTVGYIAPEVFCRNFGGISHKSDVYSYGMMLLEIVRLRRKIGADSEQTSENYFPNWIYEHLELGKDLENQGVMNEEEEETSRKMILVGLWCIQTNPADRPAMSKVVEMLEGSLEHLQIPPKPFLDFPPMTRKSAQESWTSSISS